MNLNELIQPGIYKEETFLVEENHIAAHVGSGSSRVLATPWMIAFMERIAHRLLAERLLEGYSSVGTLVNIRHLAPTPVGSTVRVRGEVLEVDGMQVNFSVQAWDEIDLIGDGQHQRVVIEEARFLRRVESKLEKIK
jgi:fluoroacetyl-CoA thioesterase